MQLPRFYPILDTEWAARRGCAPELVAGALLEAGVKILQFRHKGHFSRGVFDRAEQVAGLCREAGSLFVIDDRADIAMLLDAGLHLGQDDLMPGEARRLIGPKRLLGFSTHNEAQLRAALDQPADYLALGPIFATGSKQNPDPIVGVEELRRLRSVTARPLVAIGGISPENAGLVLAAGADSVAVIAGLYPEEATASAIRRRAEEWLAAVAR
ncbi:MAG TPA: thiamine phosphate synthase [Bryobacteraceae bacterium]|nr:thiamine phosphate synthase [Bryobacteraceae bacterium]